MKYKVLTIIGAIGFALSVIIGVILFKNDLLDYVWWLLSILVVVFWVMGFVSWGNYKQYKNKSLLLQLSQENEEYFQLKRLELQQMQNDYVEDEVPQTNSYAWINHKHCIITSTERVFYDLLKVSVDTSKYIILLQPSLASVVNIQVEKGKRSEVKNSAMLEVALACRADFAIIDNLSLEPLILIELNDSTHEEPARIARDRMVNKICEYAKLPLLTFHAAAMPTKNELANAIALKLAI